jgi:ketosteroid isomerase-like protein
LDESSGEGEILGRAMSEENVELARQVVQAFNRRDLAAMSQRFDPEIEWQPGGPAAIERAVYRGRDEVSTGFAAAWETWEVFILRESEVRDLGDSLVWLGRARLRGGDASHVELDQEFAIHFLVQGERIVRIRGFREWQEALEAAGLSE